MKANDEKITDAAAIIKLHRNDIDNLRKVDATTNQERVSKKVSKEVSSALYHNKKATPLPKNTSIWLFMAILLL